MHVRFGEFVFDGEARDLAREGRRVELSPKAFLLLEALLAERPRALSRAELDDRPWPGTAMGYTSLAGVVAELRKALDDDRSKPRLLRTVHRFGYAFCGEAVEERLGARVSFGCALRIDTSRVSRRHARIVVEGTTARLEDLGSKNGTFLWGRRLTGGADLEDGDEIGIGRARFTFRAAYGPGSTVTG